MSLAGFVVSSLWTIYGHLVQDKFITVSCGLFKVSGYCKKIQSNLCSLNFLSLKTERHVLTLQELLQSAQIPSILTLEFVRWAYENKQSGGF